MAKIMLQNKIKDETVFLIKDRSPWKLLKISEIFCQFGDTI